MSQKWRLIHVYTELSSALAPWPILFPVGVPSRLRQCLGGRREIKKSLRTTDLRTARTLARVLALKADNMLYQAERQIMAGNGEKQFDPAAGWGLILNVNLKQGTVHVETDPEKPEDAEQAVRALQALAPVLVASRQPSAEELANLTAALPPNVPGAATGRRLSEVANDFIRVNGPKWVPQTASDYRTTIDLFIKFAGDLPIRTITRKTVNDFKVAMADSRMSLRTLDKKIMTLNGLFNYALNSGDLIGENPASRQSVLRKADKRKQLSYQPFSSSDLRKIFNPADYLPGNSKPNQYWIPLIALYSGMRIEEICQLQLADVREVEGFWCFDIKGQTATSDSPRQSVKTNASVRLIPVHPALIELGLIDYIRDVLDVAGDAAMLFPYLIETVNGYSKTTGAHFGKYLDCIGICDPLKVFHSFRKTAN